MLQSFFSEHNPHLGINYGDRKDFHGPDIPVFGDTVANVTRERLGLLVYFVTSQCVSPQSQIGKGNVPCRHKYRFPVVSRRLLQHPIALEPGRAKRKPSRPARSSLTLTLTFVATLFSRPWSATFTLRRMSWWRCKGTSRRVVRYGWMARCGRRYNRG